MVAIGKRAPVIPIRMMAPLPYCFSIWETASSRALSRSFRSSLIGIFFATVSAMTIPPALWACAVR